MTPQTLLDAVNETTACALENKTSLFLADCSSMEVGHGVFDLFKLVKDILELDQLRATFREAIIRPSHAEAAKNVVFWHAACNNRGLWVEIFDERQAAIDWLKRVRRTS